MWGDVKWTVAFMTIDAKALPLRDPGQRQDSRADD
jgi:hypothetical protein